jgi:hypothetical protein
MPRSITSRLRLAAYAAPLALALLAGSANAQALGTQFTYQGQLNVGGVPAVGGTADLRFRVYDAAAGGLQQGATLVANNIIIQSDGRFVTELDFGASAFGANARWIEIDVRRPAGSANAFVTLTPRQRLNPTPNAAFASSAGSATTAANANALSGQSGAFYQNASNLNAGTVAEARLPATVMRTNSNQTITSVNTFNNVANVFTGNGAGLTGMNAANITTGALPDARLSSNVALRNGGNTFNGNQVFNGGFVGIGRSTPVTGADQFSVSATAVGYNGMYLRNEDNNGWPFYGYTTPNVTGWTYMAPLGPIADNIDAWYVHNNGERLTVTNQGRVGINLGTNNPRGTLDIVGDNFSNANLLLRPGNRPDVGINLGVLAAASGPAALFFAQYNATTNAYNDRGALAANGLWGFGTTNPLFDVHVASSTDTQIALQSTSANGRTWSLQSTRGNSGQLHLDAGFQIIDRTANVAHMVIGSNGKVSFANGTVPGFAKLNVLTDSNSIDGVRGWTTQGNGWGVEGRASANGATGVRGNLDSPSITGAGVEGSATNTIAGSWAGRFFGNVTIAGSLSATSKSFRIDHPQDPANKELWHASIESDQYINVYSGNITTDAAGYATITLPAWMEATNHNFRYQLTVIDEGEQQTDFVMARVVQKVANNQFAIKTSAPNVEVSWQLTGERKDAWALKNPLQVEQNKLEQNRGKYINPEAFGFGDDKRLEYTSRPDATPAN